MGFWSKAKGFFGRVGNGIKNAAVKSYNWLTNNKDKIQKGVDTFNDITKNKYGDATGKGMDYLNKGLNMAGRLGIG